ncbi:unnamed protein product [Leptidea sinapis]|uniref:Kazal-like domain-containing protein n=1 Tax=Leptidea sinapis TaxID=189913 RepID=A0A5E4QBT0_9NEOP|nr:unnamed protein product [Leptidea sinapis]
MQTHFAVATIGLFCLISSTTSQVCYSARVCIHNNVEKCAYRVTDKEKCDSLPPLSSEESSLERNERETSPLPINDQNSKMRKKKKKTARSEFSDVASIINKYWCWRAKHCTNTGTVVCGRDLRNKARKYFVNTCAMYKVNCLRRYVFIAIKEYICAGQKLYDAQNSVRSQYAMEWEHVPRLNITAARKKG